MSIPPAFARTVLLAQTLLPPGAASDEEIVESLRGTRVAIRVADRRAASYATQSAVVTLTQLVMAYGAEVHLCVADTELAGPQPPLKGSRLRNALLDFARDQPTGRALALDEPAPGDMVFSIGGDRNDFSGRSLSWTEWAGGLDRSSAPVEPRSLPFGALAAAAVASVEPFKDAIRRLAEAKDIQLQVPEQLSPAGAVWLDFRPTDVAAEPAGEPWIDFISAGAICQATVHALLRVPSLAPALRVWDSETVDETNLNRYLLCRASDVGRRKADVLALLAGQQFSATSIVERFGREALRTDKFEAHWMVVGVDHIPSRWLAQEAHPKWLGLGATADFLAASSEHRARHQVDQGCAGCLYPTDDDINAQIPTVSFVSYLAGLGVATRLVAQMRGDTSSKQERALFLSTLRMDLPGSQWRQPVPQNSRCPLHRSAELQSKEEHLAS